MSNWSGCRPDETERDSFRDRMGLVHAVELMARLVEVELYRPLANREDHRRIPGALAHCSPLQALPFALGEHVRVVGPRGSRHPEHHSVRMMRDDLEIPHVEPLGV